EVDFRLGVRQEAEVLERPAAGLAEGADAVRVVDHDARPELRGEIEDRRQVRAAPVPGKDAVDDDELAGAGWRLFEEGPQIRHVVVTELLDLAEGQPAAVDDRRVVLAIAEDHVALADERRDRAEVGLESGREDERGLLVEEAREAALE